MRDETLGPGRRVKKRQDFLRIQEEARKYRSRHLLVAICDPARSGGQSRVGITITKKVDKRAVVRNRLKRWVREAFRRKRSRFLRNVDVVVIALQNAGELDYASLNREFHFTLCQAGVLPEHKGRLLDDAQRRRHDSRSSARGDPGKSSPKGQNTGQSRRPSKNPNNDRNNNQG